MLKSIILSRNMTRGFLKEEELHTLKIVVALDSDTKFAKANEYSIPWETALKMKDVGVVPTIRVEEVHYYVFHAVFYLRMTSAVIFDIDSEPIKYSLPYCDEGEEEEEEEERAEKGK